MERLRQEEAAFILITSLLDKETYPDAFLVREYKHQWKVENCFRFLKQPLILGPVYLKKPEALLAATYIEFRVRHTLEVQEKKLINIAGRPEGRPTFKTIRELIERVEIRLEKSVDRWVRKIAPGVPGSIQRVLEAAGFHPAICTHPYEQK